MPREAAFDKGRRLLVEGRVRVLRAQGPTIAAEVRGDSGEVYMTGHEHGAWRCTCPALGRCSHITALMLVFVRPTREGT